MQKSKEKITDYYEECLNAEVARMIAKDNLGDNAFDILHFVELYLRDQFHSSAVGHGSDDLTHKGCRLHYTASGKLEGHLNITVRPSLGYTTFILLHQETK